MASTDTPELGSLDLPKTEPYRVTAVGAVYRQAQEAIGGDGKPTVVYTSALGARGEEIQLEAAEARRLESLGAVRPADAERGYDELSDDELADRAAQRGLTIRSSSADPEKPQREDYINALQNADRTSGGVTGVATVPGGVVATGDDGVGPVLVDGQRTALSTEQDSDVETSGLDEGAALAAQPTIQERADAEAEASDTSSRKSSRRRS